MQLSQLSYVLQNSIQLLQIIPLSKRYLVTRNTLWVLFSLWPHITLPTLPQFFFNFWWQEESSYCEGKSPFDKIMVHLQFENILTRIVSAQKLCGHWYSNPYTYTPVPPSPTLKLEDTRRLLQQKCRYYDKLVEHQMYFFKLKWLSYTNIKASTLLIDKEKERKRHFDVI